MLDCAPAESLHVYLAINYPKYPVWHGLWRNWLTWG